MIQQKSTAVYPDRNMIGAGNNQPTVTPPLKGYLQLCHAPGEHTNFFHFLFYDLPHASSTSLSKKTAKRTFYLGVRPKDLSINCANRVKTEPEPGSGETRGMQKPLAENLSQKGQQQQKHSYKMYMNKYEYTKCH